MCVDSKFTFSDTTPNNSKDDICKLDTKRLARKTAYRLKY